MSPLSTPVLGAAALVASPALWAALDGTMPMDVALTRYLIAVGICWALISLVAEFALPSPARRGVSDDQPQAAEASQTIGDETAA